MKRSINTSPNYEELKSAINILSFEQRRAENGVGYCKGKSGLKKAIELVIVALKREIPKALIPDKKIPEIGKCPNCKTELCFDNDLHFCPTCGQAVTSPKEVPDGLQK